MTRVCIAVIVLSLIAIFANAALHGGPVLAFLLGMPLGAAIVVLVHDRINGMGGR